MDHYDIVEWTDWVRGVVGSARRRAMAAHLEGGCERCSGLVHQLQRIVVDAAVQVKPPEAAVRAAAALGGLLRPERSKAFRLLPVEITFDSLLMPAPAGTRGLECTNRHLVFNSRQYTVDTRLDYGRPGQNVSVVGQIVNRHGRPVAEVPAFLVTGSEVLSHAFTSRLGEFQMECRSEDSMRLCLSIDERRLIEVDLDRPRGGQPEAVALWGSRNGRDDDPPDDPPDDPLLGMPPGSTEN